MADVVKSTAAEKDVDVGVRIGVHTGTVIGGIIGTVRFHFDMWGNGIIGAVKMEEMGIAGRVHISDATARLIGEAFHLSVAHAEMEPGFVASYAIAKSFVVEHSGPLNP